MSQLYNFSKENTLRKERAGTYNEEENYIKFSQAEGSVKATLVKRKQARENNNGKQFI